MKNYVEYNNNRPFMHYKNFTEICTVDIHIHDNYEIFQALSDNIRYFVEGAAYDLKEGDIIITSNKEIHRPITINNNPYGRRFIQFDPILIQKYVDLDYSPLAIFENRKLGQNNHFIISKNDQPKINKYFSTIESAMQTNTPKSLYESRLTLVYFLMSLETHFESSDSNSGSSQPIDNRIHQVRKYLDNHYAESFDLNALSKTHLMDKYYLSHLFKENTGFTLLEYIQSKRIKYARTLLSGNQSIMEISHQCGYDDYSNFFKTFKKLMEMSPQQYRDTLK